jgi:hypothetical protein
LAVVVEEEKRETSASKMLLPAHLLFFSFSFKHNEMLQTTFSDGYLGSRNDEERSEMRYVMRIAEFSESSNL